MKKIILTTACCLSLSAAAFANDVQGTTTETNGVGPYIGAALGIGGMDTPKLTDDQTSGNYSEKLRSGVAGRVYGGYLFGDSLKYGAEIGASLYPANKYSVESLNLKYSGYNIDALAVLKYNFSKFNVFGKAGAVYVPQKFTANLGSYDYSQTNHKILPEVAAGVGYDFTSNLSANLTYSHIFGHKPDFTADSVTKVAPVNTLMVGLTYYFN
jgi:opacity protein-like surface antigen